MLHKLLQTSAPIKHQASHLRAPDFFRTSFARFHTSRPLPRTISAASSQMATSEQLASNPSVPRAPSPSQGTGTARSNVAKTQLTNHAQAMMVSNSVNKTALHPGGVQYVLSSAFPARRTPSNHRQAIPRAHRAGRRTPRDSAH